MIAIHSELGDTLCGECAHILNDECWSSAGHVKLCVVASCLLQMGRDPEWRQLSDTILCLTCAALNTPVGEAVLSRGTWCILIHLRSYNYGVDYIGSFAEKLDDKLYSLLSRKAEFSEIIEKEIIEYRGLNFLQLRIRSTRFGIAIKDGRTPLIADRGLMEGAKSDLDTICYHLYERPQRETLELPPRPHMLETHLREGAFFPLRESASLQLKRLRPGDAQNVVSRKVTRMVFSPVSGDDVVEWIWQRSKRSVGEYISAFAKLPTGGIYYCGLREERAKLAAQEVVSSYTVEGLRLSPEWKQDVKLGLERKIREEMLWLERDRQAGKGFREITPEEHRHFSIEFIPVESRDTSPWSSAPRRKERSFPQQRGQTPPHHCAPSSPQPRTANPDDSRSASTLTDEGERSVLERSRMLTSPTDFCRSYVLEVRVAPFNGIAFHHREGPEIYTMTRAADGSYRHFPMPREIWTGKLASHGWSPKKEIISAPCTRCPLHCGHF